MFKNVIGILGNYIFYLHGKLSCLVNVLIRFFVICV